MTAALKPRASTRRVAEAMNSTVQFPTVTPRSARKGKRQQSRYHLTALPTSKSTTLRFPKPAPLPLPTSRALPAWLQLLLTVQRGSSVVAGVLVTLTLVTYGWTVYTQQLWGQEYQKLEGLQRRERQMVAANEGLKDQIAREAEQPEAGLVMPNPTTTIFLPPAAMRPPAAPAAPADPATSKPIAY